MNDSANVREHRARQTDYTQKSMQVLDEIAVVDPPYTERRNRYQRRRDKLPDAEAKDDGNAYV